MSDSHPLAKNKICKLIKMHHHGRVRTPEYRRISLGSGHITSCYSILNNGYEYEYVLLEHSYIRCSHKNIIYTFAFRNEVQI